MRIAATRLLAIAAALGGAVPAFPQTLIAGKALDARCDAACLRRLADGVIASMLAHDPAQASLDTGARFTENAIALPPGEGLWATATKAPGETALYIPDPVTGEIGLYGVMEENGVPVMVAMRLRAHRGKVADLETIVVRSTSGLYNPDGLRTVEPAFRRIKPPAGQLPREKLVEIADAYFDGLEQDSAAIVRFHPECHRNENGIVTAQPAGRPAPPPRAAAAGQAAPLPGVSRPPSCAAGFDSKAYSYIGTIGPRRWFAVDPERGLAMVMTMFVHPGTAANADEHGPATAPTGTGNRPRRNLRPFNTLMAELFEIEDGGIREVLAVGTSLPYRIGSGWD
ncbi:MAG: hypothetical protein JWL91_2660 [Sphingomonas bacterium]|nr:hypothetical protein [Sphingomonas bacterium]MDB5690784.1 hypothetical protein [Sphingomonas bacterium]